MKTPPRVIWSAVAVIATGTLVFCWKTAFPAGEVLGKGTPVTLVPEGGPKKPAANPLGGAFEQLRGSPDSRGNLDSLRQLQEKLRSMPPGEAVRWTRDFLGSGKDKSTGLSFQISSDHTLSEWPTFRTFLLDAISAIDPQGAASLSRELLASPTTADEWALALRNVGKAGDPNKDNAYLREKTVELIGNPAWQAEPSVGYLNAFDVLVATDATETTPLLSSLIQRKERKDLAHAGFLTLDRLVQRQPVDVLGQLAADRALQESRPEMVAQQFARADLRDPAQREIVRNWMLDPARTPAELNSFAGVYPNNNRFVSNNLLTSESAQTGGDLAAHDREVREIIDGWTREPAFQRVDGQLRAMIGRLDGFIGKPASGDVR